MHLAIQEIKKIFKIRMWLSYYGKFDRKYKNMSEIKVVNYHYSDALSGYFSKKIYVNKFI